MVDIKLLFVALLWVVGNISVMAQIPNDIPLPPNVGGGHVSNGDVWPTFPGGSDALMKYLMVQNPCPAACCKPTDNNPEIAITIDTFGVVGNAFLSKTSGCGVLDSVALKHVEAMPDWIIATQNGKPEAKQIVVSVTFNMYVDAVNKSVGYTYPYKHVLASLPKEDSVYKEVEVMPEFPGGEKALMQYIASVRYPSKAFDNDWQGTPYISFTIDSTGQPVNFSIARHSSYAILDQAALKHLSLMPKWTPGYQGDKPVNVEYTIAVRFKLE